MEKPKKRSKIRMQAGRIFYTFKKFGYWYFSGTRFAQKIEKKYLPNSFFSHQTPLLRKLKDVDMWMQQNKVVNLKIALKQLNGLVISPGKTFSYWRQIGTTTKRKGYLEGMVLHNGTFRAGVGGGLCQLSNLIFWLTLHTPLTVTERWRHTYDVFPDVQRDQPFGSGATCAYPNIDLQIKNTTQQKFQLKLEVTDTHLVGTWLSDKPQTFSYKIFEKEHEIKGEWWGGYVRSNKIFRKIFHVATHEELKEELVAENQALMMYNPFLK